MKADTNIVELAKATATKAHEGRFRRDGVTPYIEHPAAVAKLCAGLPDEIIAAAWLHDVMEDTLETPETLRRDRIPENVIHAVECLSKNEDDDDDYEFYLFSVCTDEIARYVKVADMISSLMDAPTPAQVKKYTHGLMYLANCVPDGQDLAWLPLESWENRELFT